MLRTNHEDMELRHGFHLSPYAIMTGACAPVDDERDWSAASALNRIQVFVGDLFIDFATWRRRRCKALTSRTGPAGRSDVLRPHETLRFRS
jgi:hypothetical protein